MDETKKEAFCEWHNKPLREVTEHEMDTCECECIDCLCLVPGSEAGNE